MKEGGSLARSHAIHAAFAKSDAAIVRCILQLDPSCLETRDISNSTPLMIAAGAAAGSTIQDGIPRHPVIDLLIAAGAQKGATDSKGMTSYGTLKYIRDRYGQMMQAMIGVSVYTPGLAELEVKLMPPNGPTAADWSGGEGEESGFVDYAAEDAEFDRDYGEY